MAAFFALLPRSRTLSESTCAWWIGLWDLHAVRSWDIGSIAFYFSIAAGIYLNARLDNSLRDHGGNQCQAWPIRRRVAVAGAEYRFEPDWQMVVPMTIASGVAAIFIRSRWVQSPSARDSNRRMDLVLCRIADVFVGMISGECALTECQTIQLEWTRARMTLARQL